VSRVGRRQRWDGELALALELQALTGRHQAGESGDRFQQPAHLERSFIHQVLKVVQEQECRPVRERGDQLLPRVDAGRAGWTHRFPHRVGDALPVRKIDKRHEPDGWHGEAPAVGEPRRHLDRQPRLPAAAGTGERHQPLSLQPFDEFGDLRFTAEEAGEAQRKATRGLARGRRERERGGPALRIAEVEEALRGSAVARAVEPQVGEPEPGRQVVANAGGRDAREKNLPRGGGRQKAPRVCKSDLPAAGRIVRDDATRVNRHPGMV
jgi:hypothetical protein